MGVLNDLINQKFPELGKLYQSEQYKKSLELMHEKNQQNLSVDEVSRKLGMSLAEYLTYEDGTQTKTVEEYEEVINKLKGVNK